MDFLDLIIKEKLKEIEVLRERNILNIYKERSRDIPDSRDFLRAFDRDGTQIIAELKRASPSKGIICRDFDPLRIARSYQENGACAISIVTERQFFLGDISLLKAVKAEVSLPLLRKDFIIDTLQIWETIISGADAILLIARLLTEDRLKEFVSLSINEGITPLVEVHNERDLEKALLTEARIIGINNRNLSTFDIDINTSLSLKPLIPDDRIVISESGIKDREDIERLEEKGFQGFLIGESLLREKDIGKRLGEFLGYGKGKDMRNY